MVDQTPAPKSSRGALILPLLLLAAGVVMMTRGAAFVTEREVRLFIAGGLVSGLGWLMALRRGHGMKLATVWLVAIALRGALLFAEPGDDVWRYLWEGRVQRAGFNPYLHAPTSDALQSLHTEYWPRINNPEVAALYPPLTELLFRVVRWESPWAHKLLATAADLGVLALLSRRFRPGLLLHYAWNPLVLYSFAGGAHFDSLLLLTLVWAWRAHDDGHLPACAVALGAGVALKWVSAPLLLWLAWDVARGKRARADRSRIGETASPAHPDLLVAEPRAGDRATIGAAEVPGAAAATERVCRNNPPRSLRLMRALALLILGLLPLVASAAFYVRGWGQLPEESRNFASYAQSLGCFPRLLSVIWPPETWDNRRYFAVIAVVFLVPWLLRHDGFARKAESFFNGLMLLSPFLHAWYFTWLAPWAVATRNQGAVCLSISGFGYFLLRLNQIHGEPWHLAFDWWLIIWVPYAAGLLLSAWNRTVSSSS
jgi:hypothetical protein